MQVGVVEGDEQVAVGGLAWLRGLVDVAMRSTGVDAEGGDGQLRLAEDLERR